jgi:NADH-quinone oxidoreductase subunit J
MSVDLTLFLVLAAIAVATALAMLASRNAVYSALFLVLNLSTVAILYMLLNAPFIAMVQISVYAGAIMVLFLFVIMLLGTEPGAWGPDLPWQQAVAIILGVALAAMLAYALIVPQPGVVAPVPEPGFGSPQKVGELLFGQYLLPFEVTSILLLAAMVGAIVMTRDEPKEKP